jgi:hypothetical protein
MIRYVGWSEILVINSTSIMFQVIHAFKASFQQALCCNCRKSFYLPQLLQSVAREREKRNLKKNQ